MKKIGFFFVGFLYCSISHAFSIGVGTHLAQDLYTSQAAQEQISRIGKIGVRDEFYWDNFDEKGELTQRGKRRVIELSDLLSSNVVAKNNNILVLGYGNKHINGGSWPVDEKSRAKFVKYASFVCETFGKHIGYIEIWNEWNLGTGMRKFGEIPGVDAYVKLARGVIEEYKKTGCQVKVLVGGAGGDRPNWPFVSGIVNSGLLMHADGLSVHLYNHHLRSDRSVEEMSSRIQSLADLVAASNSPQEKIYITEVGYPVDFIGKNSVPGDVAASRAVRILLRAMSMNVVHGLWFYELIDSGSSSFHEEHHFGLVDQSTNLKKHARVIRHLLNSGDLNQRPIFRKISGADLFYFPSLNSVVYIAFSEYANRNASCLNSFKSAPLQNVEVLVVEPLVLRSVALNGVSMDEHLNTLKSRVEKCS